MRRTYKPAQDDEWIQPVKENFGLCCCDCGLIHDVDFRIKKGKIQFRARRNRRATAAKRRKMKNENTGVNTSLSA